MPLDEIRIGPVRLELRQKVSGAYLVAVGTDSGGNSTVGVPVTEGEWRQAKRVAGFEGMMDAQQEEE